MDRTGKFTFRRNFSEWGKQPERNRMMAEELPRELEENPYDDPALRYRIGEMIAKAARMKKRRRA